MFARPDTLTAKYGRVPADVARYLLPVSDAVARRKAANNCWILGPGAVRGGVFSNGVTMRYDANRGASGFYSNAIS